jgi:uncharacterized protein (TIGR02453 family)
MGNPHFSAQTFAFMEKLAANNNREWFSANKENYHHDLRDPFLAVIEAMQGPMADISAHYRADPKPVGGSLFRIYRDARFSKDKSPYKTWAGARFFHARAKQTSAPSFYLHIAPNDCFFGAGIWQPEPDTLKKIRDFLIENPNAWTNATQAKNFQTQFRLGGDSTARPPRGYDANHPLIADIKRKDFVAVRALTHAQVCHEGLVDQLVAGFRTCAPMVDYLCAALELEF